MLSKEIRDFLLRALQVPLHGSVICITGADAYACKMGAPEASPDVDAALVQLGACAGAPACDCWPRAQVAIESVYRNLHATAQTAEFIQRFTDMPPLCVADLMTDPEYSSARRRGELVAGGRAWLGHLSGGFIDKFVLVVAAAGAGGSRAQRLLEVCTASAATACKYRRALADLAWSDAQQHWYESDARQCASLRASLQHKARVLLGAIREWCWAPPDSSGARYRAALIKPRIDGGLAKIERVSRRLRSFGAEAAAFVDQVEAGLSAGLDEYAGGARRDCARALVCEAAEAAP